ncbi:hypothetical protein BG000_008581 [Podila horticola]|nr:hypothetical protein BG000_008581 [Podila horticola]
MPPAKFIKKWNNIHDKVIMSNPVDNIQEKGLFSSIITFVDSHFVYPSNEAILQTLFVLANEYCPSLRQNNEPSTDELEIAKLEFKSMSNLYTLLPMSRPKKRPDSPANWTLKAGSANEVVEEAGPSNSGGVRDKGEYNDKHGDKVTGCKIKLGVGSVVKTEAARLQIKLFGKPP